MPATAPGDVKLLLELAGPDGLVGKITVLKTRPEDGKGYHAVADGLERPFVISRETFETLSRTLDDFKK